MPCWRWFFCRLLVLIYPLVLCRTLINRWTAECCHLLICLIFLFRGLSFHNRFRNWWFRAILGVLDTRFALLAWNSCCTDSSTPSSTTCNKSFSSSDIIRIMVNLSYFALFCNLILENLLSLFLFFVWFWFPIIYPWLIDVQLVYDVINFIQVWLILSPDQMTLAKNMLVKVFIIIKAYLTIIMIWLRFWNSNDSSFFSEHSFRFWSLSYHL